LQGGERLIRIMIFTNMMWNTKRKLSTV